MAGSRQAHPRAGEYVRGAGGYLAFRPILLGAIPQLDLGALEPELSAANIALGRLDGLSVYVPNPDWFVYLYVRKEAVLSSQIEGTQTSLSDLLEFEAGRSETGTEEKRDIEEVTNYVRALNGAVAALQERDFSVVFLQAIHADLMEGVRGEDKMPGALRPSQNWISRGGSRPGLFNSVEEAVFVPPTAPEVPGLMQNLESYLIRNDVPALVQAGVAHAQFETIHPFLDGNGRLGRLLVVLILSRRGVLRRPLLYLSAFLLEHKAEYYQRLMDVRERGDWEGWLVFFLEAVRRVADEACATARRVVALQTKTRADVREKYPNRTSAHRVLDLLFERPIVSTTQVAEALEMDFVTAGEAITSLVEMGVLKEITGRKRGRVYRFAEYMNALDSLSADE